jgi:ABC-2 type transport system ATP-binding protein
VKFYQGEKTPALNGIDMSITTGDIFGLLGPNGAGKTTAISIMSTLMRSTKGTVTICGIDVETNPREVRKLIGLVPQEIALYPTLTTFENLQYFGRLYGMEGSELKKRIQECLIFVGLTDKSHQKVASYSGGMKRRANLAAGVLNRPRILFLDEPTVGIDAQSRNLIMEKLLELKKTGTTMIYTTHYMEEAEHLCDSLAIIDEGSIVANGLPKDLIGETPSCENLGDVFLALTGKQLRD